MDVEEVLVPLGQRIRALRRGAKLTLEDLAERTEASVTHLGGVERGKHNVSVLLLARIAHALNVSLATLVEFDDREPRALRAELARRAKRADGDTLRRMLQLLDSLRG